MDKLTARQIIQREAECVSRQQCDQDCGKCDLVMDANNILAAYARAIELLEAEERGELVQLPCKPDAMFYIQRKGDDVPCQSSFDGALIDGEGNITLCVDPFYETIHGGKIKASDIGKTVFLARDEVRAAQKE
jgi:hypothetical protein